jgi:hypothetical protein
MLLIDMEQGRMIEDDEIKASLADAEPYADWLSQTQFKLEDLPEAPQAEALLGNDPNQLLDRQQAFGYTQEDLSSSSWSRWRQTGEDPIGSMGGDIRRSAMLSKRAKLLYDYFKQNFAQVTNPPIDPIREELVMSLVSMIGPRPNLLGRQAGTHKRLEVSASPILTNVADLAKDPRHQRAAGPRRKFKHRYTLDIDLSAGRGRPRRASRRASWTSPVPLRPPKAMQGRHEHPDPVSDRGTSSDTQVAIPGGLLATVGRCITI